MIVTVTLNAAIDRTLTVPNFPRGQRHRARAGVTLAGGKGINVARALKALGVPVVATGLVGGSTGSRIVEALTREAILNDFVHIEGESRTSTAVVDPTQAFDTAWPLSQRDSAWPLARIASSTGSRQRAGSRCATPRRYSAGSAAR